MEKIKIRKFKIQNIRKKKLTRKIYEISVILGITIFIGCSSSQDEPKIIVEEKPEEKVIILNHPLVGVQRWDMYSGKGTTQDQKLGYIPGAQGFLKSEEWHHRAPFFVRRTEDVD